MIGDGDPRWSLALSGQDADTGCRPAVSSAMVAAAALRPDAAAHTAAGL
jgi:hypothetical protein